MSIPSKTTLALVLALFTSCVFGDQVTPDKLRATETKIKTLVDHALPCTVALIPGGRTRQFGTGSGVVVSPDGLILTAAHVSMEMGGTVTVQFPSGDRETAKVLGMDFSRDAGMLQITSGGDKVFPFVDLGDSEIMNRNDWCIALGHAGGFQADRTPPVRLGRVISNDARTYLTSDCTLIGGDSGGPLFDLNGRLIGIHSNIGYSLSQNNHVPISAFTKAWVRLKRGDRFGGEPGGLLQNPDPPMIGAVLSDAEFGKGASIQEVMEGSPAHRAGLRAGDVVLKFGDKEIDDVDTLIKEIRQYQTGDSVDVFVKHARSREERTLTVKLSSAEKLEVPKASLPQAPTPRNSGPMTPKERRTLQAEFNKLMNQALEDGALHLNPGHIEKFGGPRNMMRFMNEFAKTVPAGKLEQLMSSMEEPEPVTPRTFDPDKPVPVMEGFFRDVLNAFRPSVSAASDSTHLVFRGKDWKSLCTVVHEDGLVLTKASEVEGNADRPLRVLLGKGKLKTAEIVKTYPQFDLALLKLKDAPPLTPVIWHEPKGKLPLGTFVSAAGSGPDSVAIGVVSVQSRSMTGKNKGFLGISTMPDELGVRVGRVLGDGNAGRAGIRAGDVITQIDEHICDTPEKLIRAISNTPPGEDVEVHFLRNSKKQQKTVKLRDRGTLDRERAEFNARHARMNEMGTDVSKHSSGFPNALQTDLPIQPQQCGGPVVDLNGNVIGINIARAGRIRTYALPSKEVIKLIKPELP